jgi:hypothetical protein
VFLPLGNLPEAGRRDTGRVDPVLNSAFAVHAQGEGHAALVTAEAAVVERFLLAALLGLPILQRQATGSGVIGAEEVLHGGVAHRVFSHLPVTLHASLEGELIDTAHNARVNPADDNASAMLKKQE